MWSQGRATRRPRRAALIALIVFGACKAAPAAQDGAPAPALAGATEARGLPAASAVAAANAGCTARLSDGRDRDVETDYLPHVLACATGAALPEALRAQAIAARSYLALRLETSGAIGVDELDTGCGRVPGPQHLDASMSTAGSRLQWRQHLVAGFAVPGATPLAGCVAGPTDPDPSGTEPDVTYNAGRSGDQVRQTPLGLVDLRNPTNRGCLSVSGAECLAAHGARASDILAFYYGADVIVGVSTAACSSTVTTACVVLARPGSAVDEQGPCFAQSCAGGAALAGLAVGQGGHELVSPLVMGASVCQGFWNLSFEEPGAYLLEVSAGQGGGGGTVTYRVRHAGIEAQVHVDQGLATGWLPLGVFRFTRGTDQWVQLGDGTTSAPRPGAQVVFDAVRLTRVEGVGGAPVLSASVAASGGQPGGCTCTRALDRRSRAPWGLALMWGVLVWQCRSAHLARRRGARPAGRGAVGPRRGARAPSDWLIRSRSLTLRFTWPVRVIAATTAAKGQIDPRPRSW